MVDGILRPFGEPETRQFLVGLKTPAEDISHHIGCPCMCLTTSGRKAPSASTRASSRAIKFTPNPLPSYKESWKERLSYQSVLQGQHGTLPIL